LIKRFSIFSLIGLLSGVIIFILYFSKVDYFKSIDLKLSDVRFKLVKSQPPDKRVIIIAIDSKSINELGRFPWNRDIIAKLIDSLEYYQVKTIAFDIVFSELSEQSYDVQLSNSIKNGGNVILGYFFREESEIPSSQNLEILENKAVITDVEIGKNVKKIPIPSLPNVELNIQEISENAESFGFFNIFPDRDGIIRNALLLSLFDGNIYPSLPIAALKHFTNQDIKIKIEDFGINSLSIGNRIIPSDEFGNLPVNFYGPQKSFPYISAVDVIKKRLEDNILKDSLVFIGATEIGIYDLRPTPVDSTLPGVEIHATVTSNFLQNNFLIRNGYVVSLETFFIFLFPLILSFYLSLTKRTFLGLLGYSVTMLCYTFINITIFKKFNFNINIISPALSLTLSYFISEAYRNLIEEKQSRFIKKAFSSYVSDKLVEQISKNPDLLKLGGEKREITILFSDIRGFTTLSEKTKPEQLVELLNEYFTPMTNITLANNGTLDKYIGDAIMAIFNAPMDVPDHTYYACKTALEMIENLAEVNKNFQKKGYPTIDIGIGLNTGEAIVGNMGTDRRFDYTAIGDSVNLASRLEGTNKVFGTRVIVSESTYNHVKDKFNFRMLDKIQVKGKHEGVTIYELNNHLADEIQKSYHKALNFYFERNFSEAFQLFNYLIDKYNDQASKTLSERCKYYIDTPPSDSWNGVFILKSK